MESCSQDILQDTSEENLQNFMQLLTSLARLNISSGEKLIK
jgi:hypothetical protein